MNYIVKIIIYFDIFVLFFFKNIIYINFNVSIIKVFLKKKTFIIYNLYINLKNNIYLIINKIKYINFKINIFNYIKNSIFFLYKKVRNIKLKSPSLNIYYPIESSLFSITLRITGILIVFIFLILYLLVLFIVIFILNLLLIIFL
jgi:hypothetical protein